MSQGLISRDFAERIAETVRRSEREREGSPLKRSRRGPIPLYQLFLARITGVTGTENATYSAEAVHSDSVTVTDATPINRKFDTSDINYNPAGVNDVCIILVDPDGTKYLMELTETIGIATCLDVGPPVGMVIAQRVFA